MSENNRIGYYSIIPATVLFNEKLKPNEKLLYAVITALANKEGYCYASNKYLAEKLKVDPKTISSWITDLRKQNFIYVEIIRNKKQEIIERKIYPHDVPYTLNNGYPYPSKNVEGIHQKIEDNNINNNNINTHTAQKKKYAGNVTLYDYEYKNLLSEYGENKTKRCIEELSLYKKSKGIEYESDFATIKRWVVFRVEELESKDNKKNKQKEAITAGYEKREYSKEFFRSLYKNLNIEKNNISKD